MVLVRTNEDGLTMVLISAVMDEYVVGEIIVKSMISLSKSFIVPVHVGVK